MKQLSSRSRTIVYIWYVTNVMGSGASSTPLSRGVSRLIMEPSSGSNL